MQEFAALSPVLRRYAKQALFLLLLTLVVVGGVLIAPSEALADSKIVKLSGGKTWTVYAFGNAQAVSDVLRAVANFSESGVFKSIVAFLALVGVIVVGMSSGFSSGMSRKFVSYIVFVFLSVYVIFGVDINGNYKGALKVQVDVIDLVDSTWKSPVTVPAVVGIPAALISTAGKLLTEQVESSFMLPDNLRMSNGAPFNLAANLISDMSKAKIQDQNLANSLAYYIQDCFMIGAARNELDASTLLTSTNFLEDIKTDYVSIYVNSTLGPNPGESTIMTCQEGYNAIKSAIDSQGGDAASFLTDASAWHSTPALNVVNSAADTVAAWAVNGVNGGGGEMVKQAAVLSAFKPAFEKSAMATGNSDFLTALAVTQASESQKSGWIVGAEVFNRIMGYIFAVLQVFVYAITPLIFAAALIPSLGMSLLKNFSQVLLWLAIWQPMLAIVNFIVISMQRAPLGGALSASGDSAGFTLSNLAIVSERTANMGAAATFVGTMVPMLAWAFVKGSVDFSRLLSSAVGENFAQQGGSTLATGNFSLNQGSLDSFTANKTSISAMGDWGNGFSTNSTERFGDRRNFGGVEMMGGGSNYNAVLSGNVNHQDTGAVQESGAHVSGFNQVGSSETGMRLGRGSMLDNTGGRGNTVRHTTNASASASAAQSIRGNPGAGGAGLGAGTGGGGNPNPNDPANTQGGSRGGPSVQGQAQLGAGVDSVDDVNANQRYGNSVNSDVYEGGSKGVQSNDGYQGNKGGSVVRSGSFSGALGYTAPMNDYDRAMMLHSANSQAMKIAKAAGQEVNPGGYLASLALGAADNDMAQRYADLREPGSVREQAAANLEEAEHLKDEYREKSKRNAGPSERLQQGIAMLGGMVDDGLDATGTLANRGVAATVISDAYGAGEKGWNALKEKFGDSIPDRETVESFIETYNQAVQNGMPVPQIPESAPQWDSVPSWVKEGITSVAAGIKPVTPVDTQTSINQIQNRP